MSLYICIILLLLRITETEPRFFRSKKTGTETEITFLEPHSSSIYCQGSLFACTGRYHSASFTRQVSTAKAVCLHVQYGTLQRHSQDKYLLPRQSVCMYRTVPFSVIHKTSVYCQGSLFACTVRYPSASFTRQVFTAKAVCLHVQYGTLQRHSQDKYLLPRQSVCMYRTVPFSVIHKTSVYCQGSLFACTIRYHSERHSQEKCLLPRESVCMYSTILTIQSVIHKTSVYCQGSLFACTVRYSPFRASFTRQASTAKAVCLHVQYGTIQRHSQDKCLLPRQSVCM